MVSRRAFLSTALALPALGLRAPVMAQAPVKVPVVATFSILADFVRRIGGDRVDVTSLVGPDGDAHSYAPTPADARALSGAKLVVVNGLGFEGWISRLIRSSGTRAKVVTATTGIAALKAVEGDGHSHGHSHGAAASDPHAWQNVANARIYVTNIRDALIAADPDGKAAFENNAAEYLTAIAALDVEIRTMIALVPAERRRILTNHDAFQYFSKAYGIELVALRGVASDSEPSARDIANVIRQIKQGRITALFLENITDPRAMQRIAAETGAKVGGQLFSDALSPAGGPAPDYLAMMRHNARQIVGALTQS
ncbi:metal ABC transporter substrate-binding protein [Phreatobacter aquaticus]|uniref:Metal ABC transporter substrate-binding protein n=1 Tax=Phreatobacter aquaticus TaxID=2570229 RepID=A0A4D7QDF4_9HYPH|nr:metal ABC transporter substrate-binding protein [Phreatobacter aquaticus]QCK84655.1 metal ABC transporter substrate-binding protein [Phreatobacter aquaticus]